MSAGAVPGVVPVDGTSGVSGPAAGASPFVGVPVTPGEVLFDDSAFEFESVAGGDVGPVVMVPENGGGPLPVGSVADEPPPQALKKRTAALTSPNRVKTFPIDVFTNAPNA